MEKLKNEFWESLLGYVPDRETKELLLAEVAATGKPLQQVIGEGKTIPIMAKMVILDEKGRFEYNGKMINVEEWKKINSLGEYGRLITISTHRKTEIKNNK